MTSFDRRSVLLAASAARLAAPAFAQNTPLRIGVLAPVSGAAGYSGENGLRSLRWAV